MKKVLVFLLFTVSCAQNPGEDYESFRRESCIESGGKYYQIGHDWECIEYKD